MLDRELRLLGFARLRFGARGHFFFIKKIRNLSRATCIQEYIYIPSITKILLTRFLQPQFFSYDFLCEEFALVV